MNNAHNWPIDRPPTGTVTFLFTDIEGSTRRWEGYPLQMKGSVETHDTILREAIEAHGGIVFRTEGDAFRAAFDTALPALMAAIQAQRSLHTQPWPKEIAPLRVRMALHTGAVETRKGDYVGPSLNRMARLLAVAHGGQTLLSLPTEQLVRDNLPPGVALRDLGEHRLKDLQRSEHIYQLVIADLPSDFPPLSTLDARPNNLPVQRSPLVGRGAELQSLRHLLLRSDVGLLTMTGPGGIGKTRLALQVAAELIDEFEDGAFFVSLANITDPALVAQAIAQTLGVRQVAGPEMDHLLADYLSDRRLLLLLDNFEHVLIAAPLVAKLLTAAPGLKVLVTSREVLHIHDEQEFAVPPLGVPDLSLFSPFGGSSLSTGATPPISYPDSEPGQAVKRMSFLESLARYESVALFIQRARLVKPDFELTRENALAVAEICYRLDGLPLAIELAAARIRILTPQTMLARLQSRFKLLTGGARDLPARQQTLRGAIEWSYDLLQPGEQRLFRRMSVFVGGATLEAIEAVCNADGAIELDVFDGIASLVDKSLVRQEIGTEIIKSTNTGAYVGGSATGVLAMDSAVDTFEAQNEMETRFGMLETIREFAVELLENVEPSEAEMVYQYRADYFVALAEQIMIGAQGRQQEVWMERLKVERANLQSIMKWAVEQQRSEIAIRLGAAVWLFWRNLGSEGIKWLRQALEMPGAKVRNQTRAMALTGVASAIGAQGDPAAARDYCDESIAILRQLQPVARRELGFALTIYSFTLASSGDPEAGRAAAEEGLSLLRQAGDKWGLSFALFGWGILANGQGDYTSARTAFEESIAQSREVGNTSILAQALNGLGDVSRILGDYTRAREAYEESLALLKRLNNRGDVPALLHNLGHVALSEGEVEEAKKYFVDALYLHITQRNKVGIAECLAGLGGVAGAEKRPERAAKLFGAAQHILEAGGITILYPAEQMDYERNVARGRAQLGGDVQKEAMWAKSWEEGRAMSMEEVIDFALVSENQEK